MLLLFLDYHPQQGTKKKSAKRYCTVPVKITPVGSRLAHMLREMSHFVVLCLTSGKKTDIIFFTGMSNWRYVHQHTRALEKHCTPKLCRGLFPKVLKS